MIDLLPYAKKIYLLQREKELKGDPVTQKRIEGDPKVETIFTGADPTGAHIYVADNGHISCLDTIGFAAIGVGRGRFTPSVST